MKDILVSLHSPLHRQELESLPSAPADELSGVAAQVDKKRQADPSFAWSFVAALALSVFYLATSIYIAAHRLYWFDELFIVRIAQLPSVSDMWQALAHASDTMPPGYHMLMRIVGHVFGYSELAMRLPSVLAMIAGLLLVFDLVRRLMNGLHGLIALTLLTCSFLPYYGYEARPYAIYFMLSALALWIWTSAKHTRSSAIAFGGVLCVAVTMHYYAVLCIAPYVLCELISWKRGERPSPSLVAGLIGVALPALVLAPLAMAFSRQFSQGFWAYPSLYKLRAAFDELFPGSLFLLALIIIWIILWRSSGRRTVVEARQPAESLGWLFFCIPFVGFVIAKLHTNAFLMRYFICLLPGVCLAFAALLWRHFQQLRHVSASILALLMVWSVANQCMVAKHPERIDPFNQQTVTRDYLQLENSVLSSGKQFVLFDNPMLHLEATHYSRRPNQCILFLRPDGTEDIATARVQVNLSHYSPLRFWNLDDLKQHAGQTALIDPSPATYQLLKQAGLRATVPFSGPLKVIYFQ